MEIVNISEADLDTIEFRLYETFCRFFNMSPLEMAMYGDETDEA